MRNHGKRHGQGKKTRKKRWMTGFLQPCFLLQLLEQDRHGYELLHGLQSFMADADNYDPSIIYRIMHDMENKGLVRSYEGSISRGPKRRVYSITGLGKKQLVCWIDELKQTRSEIDYLLANFEHNALRG